MQRIINDARALIIAYGNHGLSPTAVLALARAFKTLLTEEEQGTVFRNLVARDTFIVDYEAVYLDGPMLAFIAAARENRAKGHQEVEAQFQAYLRYIKDPSALRAVMDVRHII